MLRPPSVRRHTLPAGLLMLVALAACQGQSPSTPSAFSASADADGPSAIRKYRTGPSGTPIVRRPGEKKPGSITVVVSGVIVDDDGAPVGDAKVKVFLDYAEPEAAFASTDGAGFYLIKLKIRDLPAGIIQGYIAVESPNHENFYWYIWAKPGPDLVEVTFNARIYRIQRIAAGESIPITIVPTDSICGYDEEFVCRVVRVIVPGSGRLTMTCEPKGDGNGGPGLNIVGYNDRNSSGQPWNVVQGEYSVSIGMWWYGYPSQSCLLTTSFEATGHN